MKCAVIIPVGPGHEALAREAKASVEKAFGTDQGPFTDIMILELPDSAGEHGRSKRRNDGIDYAVAHGAEWIFFLDADDLMAPGCFAAVSPHVGECDAIFGMIAEAQYGSDRTTLREKQLGPTSSIQDILFTDPFLTIQMGHFVRSRIAQGIRFDVSMNTGEDFKYYLDLWYANRCRKIGEVLFVNRRGAHSTGPRSANGGEWRKAVYAVFEDFCRRNGLLATFAAEGREVRFAIGNPLDLIHRHFLAGRFFEEVELAYLRDIVPPGSVILEVGANVGNHAVYYGLFMEPKKIIVIEPNPFAIELLKQNAELNGITTIDTRHLGYGVGDRAGRFALHVEGANIGAARLIPAETGGIDVVPIDSIVEERVDFIKLDVEWMELEALRGAQNTLRRDRPILFIEVMNANLQAFDDWVRQNGYTVIKEFPYVNARNFVAVPSDSPLAAEGRA